MYRKMLMYAVFENMEKVKQILFHFPQFKKKDVAIDLEESKCVARSFEIQSKLC